MLSLDSPRWSQLRHAYGPASDIPALLKQLSKLPDSSREKEPWFTLWSSLAHQGGVDSASFAAVPHVVEALASDPSRAGFDYFQFPAWVEICRAKSGVAIPGDLKSAYETALARLPGLAAAALAGERDETVLRCALSAIAASQGRIGLAEVLLELTPGLIEELIGREFELPPPQA